jgi:DNA-binding NtrC family response regulator
MQVLIDMKEKHRITIERGVCSIAQKSVGPRIDSFPSLCRDSLNCRKNIVLTGEAMLETKPRVIVADDEEVIANTLAMILHHAGFEARAVYSGEKALAIAQSFRPDMLISDVIMSGITGIDTAIEMRKMLPSCKILLFSGQACTANLLEKARTRGHEFEILTKPVHPSDLLARMRAAVSNQSSLPAPDSETTLYAG